MVVYHGDTFVTHNAGRGYQSHKTSLGTHAGSAQFAALLGVTRVTVARWEIGTVAVPKPMAKLIRMVVKSRAPRKEK